MAIKSVYLALFASVTLLGICTAHRNLVSDVKEVEEVAVHKDGTPETDTVKLTSIDEHEVMNFPKHKDSEAAHEKIHAVSRRAYRISKATNQPYTGDYTAIDPHPAPAEGDTGEPAPPRSCERYHHPSYPPPCVGGGHTDQKDLSLGTGLRGRSIENGLKNDLVINQLTFAIQELSKAIKNGVFSSIHSGPVKPSKP